MSTKKIKPIQDQIDSLKSGRDKRKLSDGYHTFEELYEHRCVLWLALLAMFESETNLQIIKALKHNDGTFLEDWFLSCVVINGKQISYHLPMKYWDKIAGKAYEVSPLEFDGHTSDDVVKILLQEFEN